MRDKTVPISARITPYQRWVIDRLSGTTFSGRSDAVRTAVAEWMDRNHRFLEKHKLGIDDFNRPRGPESEPKRS